VRLQDFMSTEVELVDQDESVEDARTRMRQSGIRHLVVTRGREILGVVSDRDLASAREGDLRAPCPVSDLMTADVVTALPTTTVRQAANLMRGRGIGCLPVVDDRGALRGIVTTSDLLDLLGRGRERPVEGTVRRTLARRGPKVTHVTRGRR
jgi:acetoin utilization protein AcuB